MSWVRRGFNHFIFVFFFVLLFGGLGAGFYFKTGAAVGAGLGLGVALFLTMVSDRWLSELLSAVKIESGPLTREMEAASKRLGIRNGWNSPSRARQLPDIFIFQAAYPLVVVTRSWGGSGTLLLSQGLLFSGRDDRIPEVMEIALDRLQCPGLARVTAASALVEVLLRGAETGWAEWLAARALDIPISRKLAPLKWGNAVQNLLLTPFVWFFGRLSQDLPWRAEKQRGVPGLSALRPFIGSRLVPGLSHETPSLGVLGLSLQMPLPEP